MTPTPEAIRQLMADLRYSDDRVNFALTDAAIDALGQYADLLAQRARETCDTCRFAGALLPAMGDSTMQGRWCSAFHSFVPEHANGQPFACAGWTAKEAK